MVAGAPCPTSLPTTLLLYYPPQRLCYHHAPLTTHHEPHSPPPTPHAPQRPYIDFSLLFSEADDGADVLNAGAFASQNAGLGLSSAIQHVVRTALETAVVYPKWYRIPWYEGGESSLEVNQLPVGVLAVTIKACTNLKVGGWVG